MMDLESGGPVRLPSLIASLVRPSAGRSKEKSRSTNQGFGLEFDLLLACVNGASVGAIRALISAELDWQTFQRITAHHRLIPQVYESLCQVADLVPSGMLEKCRDGFRASVRQALRLTRDLIRVIERFESRGIPVLAYKGPTLAAMFRLDFSHRQFVDIDLLVHPSDVPKSRAALLELGYIPGSVLTTRQEESYVRSGYEHSFDLSDARYVLELKWRVLPRFYAIEFEVAGFFDRSVSVEVGGRSVRTFCPEDLLLVLCVHAAKHAWVELSLLWDISQLIQSQPIDMDRVLKLARQLGIRRILAVNLALVERMLGTVLPPSMDKQVETEQFADPVMRRVLSVISESQQVDTESVSYFCLMLALRERLQDRARFLRRLAFTASIGEWDTIRLPARLFPLYHVVRMYRLAGRLLKYLRQRGWVGRARLPLAAEKISAAGKMALKGRGLQPRRCSDQSTRGAPEGSPLQGY